MKPWALTSIVLLAATPALAADGVLKGPYLQHTAPSSVDIDVELSKPSALTVDVTPDAQPDASARASTDATFVSRTSTFASRTATFHAVHITGLSPATRYKYVVHVDRALLPGSFVTAPEGTSHEPFSFILYGDTRTDGPTHERVVHAIAGESYDFLVNTGDFVIEGGDERAWQTFFDIEGPLLRDHCVFACVGNHELVSDQEAAHFERYLGPEIAAPSEAAAPVYGSFRWGRARFFLLNAFTSWSSGPERAWLDDALSHADHEPDLDLRVAVIHQGPYSAGPHAGSKSLKDAHIPELLTSHHVDLVLSGHDHIYERGEAKGLKYIVSGGGGAPLYQDLTPLPSTRKVESTYNYVLITVTDKDVSTIAKRPDGSVVDRCSFARGGSWDCDPPRAAPAPSPQPAPSKKAPADAAQCGCRVPGRRASTGGLTWAVLAVAVASAMARRGRRSRG
jgi:hypothetical protein